MSNFFCNIYSFLNQEVALGLLAAEFKFSYKNFATKATMYNREALFYPPIYIICIWKIYKAAYKVLVDIISFKLILSNNFKI